MHADIQLSSYQLALSEVHATATHCYESWWHSKESHDVRMKQFLESRMPAFLDEGMGSSELIYHQRTRALKALQAYEPWILEAWRQGDWDRPAPKPEPTGVTPSDIEAQVDELVNLAAAREEWYQRQEDMSILGEDGNGEVSEIPTETCDTGDDGGLRTSPTTSYGLVGDYYGSH